MEYPEEFPIDLRQTQIANLVPIEARPSLLQLARQFFRRFSRPINLNKFQEHWSELRPFL